MTPTIQIHTVYQNWKNSTITNLCTNCWTNQKQKFEKKCNLWRPHCLPQSQRPKSNVFDFFSLRKGPNWPVKNLKKMNFAFEVIMQSLIHALFINMVFQK